MATHRAEWEKAVEDQLAEGNRRFAALSTKIDDNTAVTKAVETQLEENTAATLLISNKLDAHVKSYETFRTSAQPAIDAILTMQSGVRFLGKIGNGIGWLAQKFRKGVIWMAPLVAFALTVWGFFHDKSTEAWNVLTEWFK